MITPLSYSVLYKNVNAKETEKYFIRDEEIKFAIDRMVEAYKPNPSLWSKKIAQVVNYDDPAYRCAYLYKYAPLHTYLVQDMFTKALKESDATMNPNFWRNNTCINICSLGGGPGIDIIGVISALHRKYGFLPCSAQIIDLMSGWRHTFDAILEEFQDNTYEISKNLTPEYFQYSYIVADLLGKMHGSVNKAIASSNLITMVKFLSAATCADTPQMIRKIFKSMRHEAVAFIVENASGGYSELVSRIAEDCRMVSVLGSMRYVRYTNPKFHARDYGSRSCFSTQVNVHLFMKPYVPPVAEWNISPKPIMMDRKKQSDYSCYSECGFIGTSGYDSYYSKIHPVSVVPQARQDKLIATSDITYDPSFPNNVVPIYNKQYKLNVHNIDYNLTVPKTIYKSQDNVANNIDCDLTIPKKITILKKQDKLNVTKNIVNDSGNKNNFMESSSNSFHSNNYIKEDIIVDKYPCKFKCRDNLDTGTFNKDSNYELNIDQVSFLADRLSSPVYKGMEVDSRLNYPVYELFPQNNAINIIGFEKLSSDSVDKSEVVANKKQVDPIPLKDLEKILLGEKTETNKLTASGHCFEVKTIPSNTENKPLERECNNCYRLKRIKWLQKACKFCNP